jgi:hypothetical protein
MSQGVVTIHRPIRCTQETVVMRPNGRVIVPIMRRHGLGAWRLEPGYYIIATIRRRRGLRALEVTAQCLEVTGQGARRILGEFTFFTPRFDKDTVVEWAWRNCGHNHD